MEGIHLPKRDLSTNEEILDSIWKIYRNEMERVGAPHHYPLVEELQQIDSPYMSNLLGVSQHRLSQISQEEIAEWLLAKSHALGDSPTGPRRDELERAAQLFLQNRPRNTADFIDPLEEAQSVVTSGVTNRSTAGGKRKKKKKKTKRKGSKKKKSRRRNKKTRRN